MKQAASLNDEMWRGSVSRDFGWRYRVTAEREEVSDTSTGRHQRIKQPVFSLSG